MAFLSIIVSLIRVRRLAGREMEDERDTLGHWGYSGSTRLAEETEICWQLSDQR